MSDRLRLAAVLSTLAAAPTFPALAAEGHDPGRAAGPAPEKARPARCEHGVQRPLCTRCNPRLAPVYKAKGDWCPEHDRPESQCALCHPELARKGVK